MLGEGAEWGGQSGVGRVGRAAVPSEVLSSGLHWQYRREK